MMSLACLKGLPLDHLKQIWPASLSSLLTALESKHLSHKRPTRMRLGPSATDLCCQRVPCVWAVFSRREVDGGHRAYIATEQGQQSGPCNRTSPRPSPDVMTALAAAER